MNSRDYYGVIELVVEHFQGLRNGGLVASVDSALADAMPSSVALHIGLAETVNECN